MREKFKLQAQQYAIPYHYCVSLEDFSLQKQYAYGLDYYAYMKDVSEIIQRLKFKKLLDVGCGDGYLLNNLALKDQTKQYKGIDLVTKAILFADAFKQTTNLSFEVLDIAYEKEKYDVVTLIQVVEHIPDDMMEVFITEVKRRVNQGGKLIVSVPALNMKVPKKHYRHYDEQSIISLIGEDFRKIFSVYSYDNSSFVLKLINKIFINRYFLLNNQKIVNKFIALANKFKLLHNIDQKNARYITVVLEKVK